MTAPDRAHARQAIERRRRDTCIERARFIYQAAREAGLSVAILEGDSGASVFVWAPLAKTPEAQIACEQSFKAAIECSIGAIRIVAPQRRKRRRREH